MYNILPFNILSSWKWTPHPKNEVSMNKSRIGVTLKSPHAQVWFVFLDRVS